ncbi:response regulator receiver modulated diguanylate cyclase [Roseovarius lutimaris]|uniref:diguanylate cyclase n=1 Tax=Roseovarius lutimaris TaxID=1005928 RepID=A0A1I5C0B2_9RHOB|nr:diguanylate cyclase [Roseovarius lutimaris]SFN80051.1 response regulator receiver modulated diguanylate cyclase [Roseovarius lutimaris]
MSDKVLIVDDLATNRIVLKVKLSAAHYEVVQATSASEALAIAASTRPDLILASAHLSGMAAADFVAGLRKIKPLSTTPIILLQTHSCAHDRHAALRAGADDILTKPVQEAVLLARLRNLLRQHHNSYDLTRQPGGGHFFGFAEAQREFQIPGRIAIVARSKPEALALQGMMSHSSQHQFSAYGTDQAMPIVSTQQIPDVYLLRFGQADAEEGLRLLAELKAAQLTHSCPVIALLDKNTSSLAVTLLDMGANDVIIGLADREELALRMANQLRHKRNSEQMRAQLLSGLQAAVVDPLTGAYNRRYALPFLKQLIEDTHQSEESFAVMVADLDFFKQVNDRFGHAAGDRVLCAVTTQLRAHLREGDMLARIGGEEFLIITPGTNRFRAQQTADRLCQMIHQTPIAVPGTSAPLHVTISIGVTMARHNSGCEAHTVDLLLDQADRALYLAKAQGRNKVTFCARSAA